MWDAITVTRLCPPPEGELSPGEQPAAQHLWLRCGWEFLNFLKLVLLFDFTFPVQIIPHKLILQYVVFMFQSLNIKLASQA